MPSLRLHNFFFKGNFNTGFDISFVGTMHIWSYTQSEQHRGGSRKALNDMAAVTYIATLLRGLSKFLVGSATTAVVAGYTELFDMWL